MNKIYISQESFPALTAILQKGISQGTHFFVYDSQNLLQNRVWTFSSQAFIPNVKSDDKLLKKHKVPVVISTDISEPSLEGYTRIFYETPFQDFVENVEESSKNLVNFIAFVTSQGIIKPNSTTQVFQKIGNKWEEVL
jgi:hypothetical protein